MKEAIKTVYDANIKKAQGHMKKLEESNKKIQGTYKWVNESNEKIKEISNETKGNLWEKNERNLKVWKTSKKMKGIRKWRNVLRKYMMPI